MTVFGLELFNDKQGNVCIYKRWTRRGVTTYAPWIWLRKAAQ